MSMKNFVITFLVVALALSSCGHKRSQGTGEVEPPTVTTSGGPVPGGGDGPGDPTGPERPPRLEPCDITPCEQPPITYTTLQSIISTDGLGVETSRQTYVYNDGGQLTAITNEETNRDRSRSELGRTVFTYENDRRAVVEYRNIDGSITNRMTVILDDLGRLTTIVPDLRITGESFLFVVELSYEGTQRAATRASFFADAMLFANGARLSMALLWTADFLASLPMTDILFPVFSITYDNDDTHGGLTDVIPTAPSVSSVTNEMLDLAADRLAAMAQGVLTDPNQRSIRNDDGILSAARSSVGWDGAGGLDGAIAALLPALRDIFREQLATNLPRSYEGFTTALGPGAFPPLDIHYDDQNLVDRFIFDTPTRERSERGLVIANERVNNGNTLQRQTTTPLSDILFHDRIDFNDQGLAERTCKDALGDGSVESCHIFTYTELARQPSFSLLDPIKAEVLFPETRSLMSFRTPTIMYFYFPWLFPLAK